MLKRVVLVLVLIVFSVIGFAPWALYGLGLHGVDGRPQLPAKIATLAEQESVWRRARGTGTPNVIKLNPYTYFHHAGEPGPHRASVIAAWWVASEYLSDHKRYESMAWWHFSGAALTIWVTRNWSTEQILSKLVEREAKHAL